MLNIPVLMQTDVYKLGHRQMYPEGTEFVQSNFTSRGSRIPEITETVHFGLQAFIQQVIVDGFEQFFAADEDQVCADYERYVTAVLGPNTVGSDHVRALHRLGYAPLRFKGLPEGTLVPLRVPSVLVENTHPEFFWLVNYIETALSASLWHPSTTATLAHRYRGLLDERAAQTGGAAAAVDFQLHDFSARGQTSLESAAASGAGHLLSFRGSDSIMSLPWIEYYYPGNEELVLASVPATEHSVMCAGGKEGEEGTFRRLLSLYPAGILSVVSDSWDLWTVIAKYLPELKSDIMSREGKLVIRPDSGDPVLILCGDPSAEAGSLARKGVVQALYDVFGGTVNAAGYIELDSHIGAIYGDSITFERADEITRRLAASGFASTNVVFGVGSYSYQYVTRDTFGSAVKATWVQINGEGRDIMKDPVTDSGTKKSATGRLAVTRDDSGVLTLVQKATPEQEASSLLTTIWEDGVWLRRDSFDTVKATLSANS